MALKPGTVNQEQGLFLLKENCTTEEKPWIQVGVIFLKPQSALNSTEVEHVFSIRLDPASLGPFNLSLDSAVQQDGSWAAI